MKKKFHRENISIPLPGNEIILNGILTVPEDAHTIVLFAHGSGSGRHSPRNRAVAEFLEEYGLATLLMDLLTEEEEIADSATGQYRFDIPLLAKRLTGATHWVRHHTATQHLDIAYFGASTGAAAALIAAADKTNHPIAAVVSRGGRPDLAASLLPKVKSPTLLIVGGDDDAVIGMNQQAFEMLGGEKLLEIVPGATHLFEEPGKLAEVAKLAVNWFLQHRKHRDSGFSRLE